MLIPSTEEFDALTRTDFNVFVERVFAEVNGSKRYLDNFHIALICSELEAVRRGEHLKLAIALPPRSLKSIIISVAYPAWLLGHDPATEVMCASYAQSLSDDLALACLKVMQSSWYCRLFPATRLVNSRQPIAAFKTTAGGIRRATSVGGSATGLGGDYIIVDDPTKPSEAASEAERKNANDWARSTLFTRLDDKKRGAIILVMQRLHEDDMIGFVGGLTDLRLISFPAVAQDDEYHQFTTPFGMRHHRRAVGEALHPDREPIEILEALRRAMGEQMFSAQYLQMPAPPGGGLVKREWFQFFDPVTPPQFDRIVQSWDTASKRTELSDWSVCITIGQRGNHLFIIHVARMRLEFPELKRKIVSHSDAFNASTVLIEEASSGIALIQDLKNDGFYKLQAFKPLGDKVMRMQAQTARIENGQVFVPQGAPWLPEFFHELTMFPNGNHDDQVDSLSQALAYFAARGGPQAWADFMEKRAAELFDMTVEEYRKWHK